MKIDKIIDALETERKERSQSMTRILTRDIDIGIDAGIEISIDIIKKLRTDEIEGDSQEIQ